MSNTYFVFDTNYLYDSSGKVYFGNQDELTEFDGYGTIIIPDTVILEREYKLRTLFQKQLETIKENQKLLYNRTSDFLNGFNIEEKIKELKRSVPIYYQVIKLSNTDIIYTIRDFGINRKPPFEELKGNSDKGFKDCYILFTTLEFLNDINKDDNVYFITGDEKLKEALINDGRIKVVANFTEYKDLVSGELLKLIRDHYNDKNLEIKNLWTSYKHDLVISININTAEKRLIIKRQEGDKYLIQGEIDTTNIFEGYSLFNIINKLRESPSFSKTHQLIRNLREYFDYLSRSEAISILDAFEKNSQIFGIIDDEDVRDFSRDLYSIAKPALDYEERDRILGFLPLPF